MIVIWGCSAARAPEFRHRNWCAKRKITWCQQALGRVDFQSNVTLQRQPPVDCRTATHRTPGHRLAQGHKSRRRIEQLAVHQ